MGSDSKLYLRIDEAKADEILKAVASFKPERRGDWLSLSSTDLDLAKSLSAELGVTTVHWDIETAVDQIWLQCFSNGKRVREVRYTSDEGWASNKGKPRSFENQKAMDAWLAKRDVLASPEGYEVLDAFLGLDSKPLASAGPIEDPGANARFQLPPALVKELRASAKRRSVTASELVSAAWELAKQALHDREAAKKEPAQLVSLAPARPVAFNEVAPKSGALSLKGFPIACAFKLAPEVSAEILSMKSAFGQTGAWMVTEAYLLSRDRVA